MLVNGLEIDTYVVGSVGTNCYVVRKEGSDKCVVIDPGASGSVIAKHVREKGATLEGILLTHGHFDHILGIPDLLSEMKAKIYALEEESEVLEDPNLNCTAMVGNGYGIKPDELMRDGITYNIADLDIKVIHTPGHTKGSCCFYIEDAKVLFCGDTLFMESIGRTDLPTGNYREIISSLREKILDLPGDVKAFSGHGPSTTIEYEVANNPYA
ncbi:MBL fold metallo-hydrolase [Eubacterium xylanophilum]|uniref:MBL fold metallo-hydrolase n=1 Tax=Eubacterium xylanophilum TaxID=39497 RepID=UPI00047CA9B2|nr:MBL fold metallo-hydrolase [Eubacterium xylanophilum]